MKTNILLSLMASIFFFSQAVYAEDSGSQNIENNHEINNDSHAEGSPDCHSNNGANGDYDNPERIFEERSRSNNENHYQERSYRERSHNNITRRY